jgi:hypothetical protein
MEITGLAVVAFRALEGLARFADDGGDFRLLFAA